MIERVKGFIFGGGGEGEGPFRSWVLQAGFLSNKRCVTRVLWMECENQELSMHIEDPPCSKVQKTDRFSPPCSVFGSPKLSSV